MTRQRRIAAPGWLVGAVVAATALSVAVTSPSASATVTDRSRVTTHYTRVAWDCGYPMDVAGVAYDQVSARVDQHTGFTYSSDNYRGSETWTAADGRSFSLSWNGLNKDVKAVPLGGSVYQDTFNQVGQPFVITDSSGTVVSRDRGDVSITLTIDISTGNIVDILGVKIAGPHPSFSQDLCAMVRSLTGGDSFRYLTAKPIGATSFPMGFHQYLPPSYHTNGPPSPLLIALNGYGENGDGTPAGLPNLLNQGIPRFINVGGWPTDRPLVVLALQHVEQPGFDYTPCDNVDPWGGSCVMELQDQRGDTQPAPCTTAGEVHDFISYATTHYNVDPKRVYVTGLSCGGFGLWEYIAKYADQQIAAAVPASGEGRPAWAHAACGLGAVPIWAFAGAQDHTVNPQGSIEPMTGLQACPGILPDRARLTVYSDFGHDAWNPAYDGQHGDDIYSWMLSFTHP
jgi:hypothetical protein